MFYYFTILTSIFLQIKTNLIRKVKSMKILQYSYSCVLTEKIEKKVLPFLCQKGAIPVAPVSLDPLLTEIGGKDPWCHLQKVKTLKR